MVARTWMPILTTLSLALAGCGEGDVTGPTHGSIVVDPDPDLIAVPWSIAHAGGEFLRGAGDTTLTDLPPGEYTVTWGEVPGWAVPDPATRTHGLAAGQVLEFAVVYEVLRGSIVVAPEPFGTSAPWQLDGPDGFATSGIGFATMSGLVPGEYRLTWQEKHGWVTPEPVVQTRLLAPGGAITFRGLYLLNEGTIVVDPAPDLVEAPWLLTRADGFSYEGTGDAVVARALVGSYTLSWGSVVDWISPVPAASTDTLSRGGTLVFAGTYASLPGTIVIDPQPDGIAASWRFTGPGGSEREGTGDATFAGMPSGDYTITWLEVPGRIPPTPNPTTRTLLSNGTLTFDGYYYTGNEHGDRFTYVPPGTFLMGSPVSEPGRNLYGLTELQHEVTLTVGFFISRYEITEREWDAVMGGDALSSLPADSVSWFDAIAYCNARSAAEGFAPAYEVSAAGVAWNRLADGYRLPTEAEWEYACRAGAPTAYASGDPDPDEAGWPFTSPVLDEIGWYSGNSGSTRHVGGLKAPNAWGLHDMHGNLWEWVWDFRGDYPAGPVVDPTGPPTGSFRMFRGGGMWHWALHARCAFRGVGDDPGRYYHDLGLRVVRSAY